MASKIERYLYNKETGAEIRKKYNLEEKFVVGNVGRMCSQKNQLFLLDVFSEILKRNKNSILLLVGDGNQRNLIEKKARKLVIAGIEAQATGMNARFESLFDLLGTGARYVSDGDFSVLDVPYEVREARVSERFVSALGRQEEKYD